MPELVPGFIKVTEAGREYKTSRSTLDRRREAARDTANDKLYRVFRLRAKDGEIINQPSKEQVAHLTKEGRVPEWFVSRSWLAKEFGKRADEAQGEPSPQSPAPGSDQVSQLHGAVFQQYEERIKDLKEQLEATRQEKHELLQYAQADKQMVVKSQQLLAQVLALPAIAEANRKRTEPTVEGTVHESTNQDMTAIGRQAGKTQPQQQAAEKKRRGLFRLFSRD